MQMIQPAYAFLFDGIPVSCEPFGHGHINQTYKVVTDCGCAYVLQRINHYVFRNPVQLMENASSVTNFIRAKGHKALHFIPTADGKYCHIDTQGQYWRAYEFVEGFSLDAPETDADFYQSALAFGQFQNLLSDFPADTLFETIPNFHHTPDRYRQFKETVAQDPKGRLAGVQADVYFYLEQEALASKLQQQRESRMLPLRVTHNDTKLNNVLLDRNTRKALCVLDLDTVMPGLSSYDFGDTIRFGATTAAEDEPDSSKMMLDLHLFSVYTKGFLEAAVSLTDAEVQALPLGAFTMTVECGLRFLKDYLDGDIYFRTAYPEHNLVRSRTQMALASDMLRKWDEMARIVAQHAKEIRP